MFLSANGLGLTATNDSFISWWAIKLGNSVGLKQCKPANALCRHHTGETPNPLVLLLDLARADGTVLAVHP